MNQPLMHPESLRKAIIRCDRGEVLQPIAGKVIPLSQIPDNLFSAGLLGPGVGIKPDGDIIYSPISGTVSAIIAGNYAIGLSGSGMEVLIHIGIDTVRMKNAGFEALVAEGEAISIGQPLLRFDRTRIVAEGLSDIVAVVLTNAAALGHVECIVE